MYNIFNTFFFQKFLSSIKSQDHLLEDPNTNITLTMSAVHADYTVKDVKEGHVW